MSGALQETTLLRLARSESWLSASVLVGRLSLYKLLPESRVVEVKRHLFVLPT